MFILSKRGDSGKQPFAQKFNLSAEQVKINAITITNKALKIKTDMGEDLNKVLNNKKGTRNKFELSRKWNPLFILYDVPTTMSNKKFHEVIFKESFECQTTKRQFDGQFKLNFKMGPRNKSTVQNHDAAKQKQKAKKKALK